MSDDDRIRDVLFRTVHTQLLEAYIRNEDADACAVLKDIRDIAGKMAAKRFADLKARGAR